MEAVLLVNTGTPDSPERRDVRRYLTAFLNDPRVITLPQPLRFFLVNFVIIPFRVGKSAGLYRRVWTDKGSPLRLHTESLTAELQKEMPQGTRVYYAMRFGKPSIREVMGFIKRENPGSLTVVPLFPQYASSTTGSVVEEIMRVASEWGVVPELRIIRGFHNDTGFITAFAEMAGSYNVGDYDHVLFSFHGLPLSHIDDMHRKAGESESCYSGSNAGECRVCYAGECHETAKLIATRLDLDPGKWSVAFQSRLSAGWTYPFTDDVISGLASQGTRKLLVLAPSFVTDCLETVVEIGEDYSDMFRELGGIKLQLVGSLNSGTLWVKSLASLISCRQQAASS